jgi:hypothetical protein
VWYWNETRSSIREVCLLLTSHCKLFPNYDDEDFTNLLAVSLYTEVLSVSSFLPSSGAMKFFKIQKEGMKSKNQKFNEIQIQIHSKSKSSSYSAFTINIYLKVNTLFHPQITSLPHTAPASPNSLLPPPHQTHKKNGTIPFYPISPTRLFTSEPQQQTTLDTPK